MGVVAATLGPRMSMDKCSSLRRVTPRGNGTYQVGSEKATSYQQLSAITEAAAATDMEQFQTQITPQEGHPISDDMARALADEMEGLKHMYTDTKVEEFLYEFDIPEDTYGAAILAIVKEMQRLDSLDYSMLPVVRLTFCVSLLLCNLYLQTLILWFVEVRVVQPAVHGVQMKYRQFHASVYDASGTFRPEWWESYGGKKDLCQIAMTGGTFYYAMLLLWTLTMMFEFRTSERFFSNVRNMPHSVQGQKMIEQLEEGPRVTSLTKQCRITLYGLVCIPKLLISTYLLWLGLRFLSSASSFENLVMNSVAMEFVIRIDEVLFFALLPEAYRAQVSEIDFSLRRPPRCDLQKSKDEWIAWGWSTLYFVTSIAVVLVYGEFVQDVLPFGCEDVKHHCYHHQIESMQPLCSRFSMNFNSSCFPYGQLTP